MVVPVNSVSSERIIQGWTDYVIVGCAACHRTGLINDSRLAVTFDNITGITIQLPLANHVIVSAFVRSSA